MAIENKSLQTRGSEIKKSIKSGVLSPVLAIVAKRRARRSFLRSRRNLSAKLEKNPELIRALKAIAPRVPGLNIRKHSQKEVRWCPVDTGRTMRVYICRSYLAFALR